MRASKKKNMGKLSEKTKEHLKDEFFVFTGLTLVGLLGWLYATSLCIWFPMGKPNFSATQQWVKSPNGRPIKCQWWWYENQAFTASGCDDKIPVIRATELEVIQ